MIAIIPARYNSVRLEGKLLLPIAGKPLILHTLERVASSKGIDAIVVATDDKRIRKVVEEAGYDAVMTSSEHQTGTDRIAEAADDYPGFDLIVNVQADEPMIDPSTIQKAVLALARDESAEIATSSEPISGAGEVLDPNVVKVITDGGGLAVYFSRSPIPFPREAVRTHGSLEAALAADIGLIRKFKKHTGLYVYRREFLKKFAGAEKSRLESIEMLEQLRAIEMGARIRVVEAAAETLGVDTRVDYERVRAAIESR